MKMLKNNIIAIIFYFILGVAVFWVGRFSVISNKTVAQEENGEKKEKDEHAGHDHHEESEEAPKLSAEMKANIGVKVKEIEKKVFVKYLEVPAIIKASENKSFLITSHAGGYVKKLNIAPGAFVKKGTSLGVLTREALPFPSFEEIKDYYQNKNIEMLLMSLNQTSNESLDYLNSYMASIGLDKTISQDLKNKSMVEQRETIFILITDKAGLWKNDLKQFYLKLTSLPGIKIPEMVPSLVIINRLGLLEENKKELLLQYCKNQKEVMVMLSLIQNNYSLEYLAQYAVSGYLSEEVVLTAPVDGIVSELLIKNGQLINSKDVLFKVVEVSSLTVESQLRGNEAALFKLAISKNEKFMIKNLQNEAFLSATYYGLNVVNLGELNVQLNIINNPISANTPQVWQYMPGDQCVLMIPEKTFASSLVLPRGAIVEEGLKRFVFMENGDNFEKVEVITAFMDKQTAVLGAETKLFEGDIVVISGAYELNIATKKPVKVSGHEGHNH